MSTVETWSVCFLFVNYLNLTCLQLSHNKADNELEWLCGEIETALKTHLSLLNLLQADLLLFSAALKGILKLFIQKHLLLHIRNML
jgi:hypothetical protein